MSCTISSSRNATVFWIKVSNSSISHSIWVFTSLCYCCYFSVLEGRKEGSCSLGFLKNIVKMGLTHVVKMRSTHIDD